MSKDMWFAEFGRHLNDLEDAGVPFKQAYDRAADMAERSLPEKLADIGDAERLRRREDRSPYPLGTREHFAWMDARALEEDARLWGSDKPKAEA